MVVTGHRSILDPLYECYMRLWPIQICLGGDFLTSKSRILGGYRASIVITDGE